MYEKRHATSYISDNWESKTVNSENMRKQRSVDGGEATGTGDARCMHI